MYLLSEEEAKALLQHDFINFSAVARKCYPDDDASSAEAKLRHRVYSKDLKRGVSKATLEMLTIAFADLYSCFPNTNFL